MLCIWLNDTPKPEPETLTSFETQTHPAAPHTLTLQDWMQERIAASGLVPLSASQLRVTAERLKIDLCMTRADVTVQHAGSRLTFSFEEYKSRSKDLRRRWGGSWMPAQNRQRPRPRSQERRGKGSHTDSPRALESHFLYFLLLFRHHCTLQGMEQHQFVSHQLWLTVLVLSTGSSEWQSQRWRTLARESMVRY